jgi:YegS/Rv2252/BmrU family lipid kinase
MQRKFIYLINPISGIKKKPVLIETIRSATQHEGFDFEIIETRKDGDYRFLRELIPEKNITDLIICGGDGSVSTVTAHLLGVPVNVGIIPTGSGNGLALAAGIPYSTKRSLSIIFKGSSSWVDGFLINGKFSCMMCGIGNDAQVAHEFAQTKVRGLKTYLKISALNYFKCKPYSFTIHANEKKISLDAFFVTVANSNQFGNNVTIAPRASLSDGLIDFVVVKKMHKLVLPFALLHQISGSNTVTELQHYRNNRNIVYFQAKEAEIINHNNAPIHIDGEPEPSAEKIVIKVLPNAFRLLQPSVQPAGAPPHN